MSSTTERDPLQSVLYALFDSGKSGSLYFSDFRRCPDHDAIVEATPMHPDAAYNRQCMVCGTADLTGLSQPLPPLRSKQDLDAVRDTWKAAKGRVAERDAYVLYLKVAVCAVRPSVLYAGDTRTQSHKDYVAFLEQFERDAFARRVAGQKGDYIMRVVCPEHKAEGHLFPSLGVAQYQSCHCCPLPLSVVEARHSSAMFEKDEDAKGVKSMMRLN